VRPDDAKRGSLFGYAGPDASFLDGFTMALEVIRRLKVSPFPR
jgi:hypothetical protein